MVKKKGKDINLILNRLWIIVVIVCILLILFGLVSNFLSYGVVLLSPEDTRAKVEVVSGEGSFKQAVNFVLVGVVTALFIVTVILLIILFLKRRRERKMKVPKFDVFGMHEGLG